MKKNEIIELNGVEYTLELNRQSALKIEQYTNMQEAIKEINKPIFEYKEDISLEENPFEDEIELDTLQEEADKKIATLHKLIERAFWIWLYPNHKLNIEQVKEILKPYFEDEDKLNFIGEKYGQYFQECVEIRESYNEEQKNLKAQINKK
jgi:hypothetical protein